MTDTDPTLDWARLGPQLPDSLAISSWNDDAIAAIRPHLTGGDWKQWDAPYFAPMNPDQVEPYCAKLATDPWQRDADTGVPSNLCLQVHGKTVGDIGWHWEHYPAGWRRIGIVLYGGKDWGRGLGTCFVGAWTEWLLKMPDTYRIDLATWSGNERMLRAARRAGYVEEARLRRARIVGGLRYDSIIMGRLKHD